MNLEIKKDSLNDSQRRAVTASLKPILVVAGAGTGKTTVLVRRFEYLVKEKNIDPEKIILVTYTNKAANQINKKISKLFDNNVELLQNIGASTFHRLCLKILESEGRNFRVCSQRRTVEYIKQIINRFGISFRANWEMSKIISKVRWYRYVENKVITENDLIRACKDCTRYTEEEIKKKYPFGLFNNVLEEFESVLKRNNCLSIDDLQFEVDKLLNDENKSNEWQEKIECILFDEFQDIDPVQLNIIVRLSEKRRNIFCVGDPDQAIYSFRNAIPESFLKFKELIDDVEILKLEENYRSTSSILDVCNELINKKKTVFSKKLTPILNNGVGELVELFVTNDQQIEVENIIETITKIQKEKQISFRNFAVFFRKWSYERELSKALFDRKIPFFSESLKNIWTKEEIKDSLAYLELAFENDILLANKALLRIINKPARGFGPKYLKKLKEQANELKITLLELIEKRSDKDKNCEKLWKLINDIKHLARKKDNFSIQIWKILTTSGLIDYFDRTDLWRSRNIDYFWRSIADSGISSIEEVLPKLKELNKFTTDKDAVYFSTIHSAKGLEFDYVFVMQMDEERRIAYVAFTRAKKKLFLSCSGGEEKISSFIKDVESHLSKSVNINWGEVTKLEENEEDIPEHDPIEEEDIEI